MSTEATEDYALSFNDLKVTFETAGPDVHAVKGLSLAVRPGEVVALVGESGSGKSVTSTAAMGLLPENAQVTGVAKIGNVNVVGLEAGKMRKMRATDIAMVFQEPMTALNPVLTIERQLTEALELHDVAYGKEATDRAIELLTMVGIPDPAKRIRQYPHQFSGGQRQRIVIAMAISCEPKVIIADEPTTALDVTVQAEILDLLRELKDRLNTGILLITHNMGVVADMADQVAVMFQGNLVETGDVKQVLLHPQHEYTQRLLSSVPRLSRVSVEEPAPRSEPIAQADRELVLEAKDLILEYDMRGTVFRAVENVSFDVAKGEVLGIVGESGSGKSTIAKAVLGLLPVASGTLSVKGHNLPKLSPRQARQVRKQIGVIFQDPAASLNPRFPIGDCITEPMVVHKVGSKTERIKRAQELLDAVKLPRNVINRYPHELSGGQRQRICIARALTLNPELLIADEPTSALDVSVQALVLEMLQELQRDFNFACLFVSHDLAVVDMLADSVVVMQNGKSVEQGRVDTVLHAPTHDYTRRLLAAAPVPDPIEQAVRREAWRTLNSTK
ncbi:glutathione ABC transporter ATP-binding protein [Arthrobacter sp. MYb211]|uniref:ABC transporter ATP-binding protein n=1 Tax=Micrococcaceae TaxID=1268 RepID=UPI000CFC1D86|nr:MULTISPECIES: ABC transporter ATP-binding protein [unclassified Arthrobacter]PRA02504.1 glutathione ABC transporter ATP-binding protein [Arthrobacter sp. MYb229]PRA13222.1 glutathione ABC transporter ATP-binding protein [Arthrobacter sp. MYb221]PRB50553.1 glutathione ABC transporter ATP-binding protein [Arthrobacter sp. MYb216]PRC10416.1 glutathione ABC transporter ATP-binding protein [Arthrobacter sp. MYb211]